MSSPALPTATAAPDAGDRMAFAMFLAGCVHALLLFGIGFANNNARAPDLPLSLDVVLAHSPTEKRPEKPDFLAQANQTGGGGDTESAPLRAPDPAPLPDLQAHAVQEEQISGAAQSAQQEWVTTSADADRHLSSADSQDALANRASNRGGDAPEDRARQMASLAAELAADRAQRSKAPRTRIVAPSTAETRDAAWLNSWRRKVERIGNLNYPEEARRQNLAGEVVLRVDVNADGSIADLRVLQSSGQKLLDDAAQRTVRLAAPFAPFPAELRKEVDVLQIVRLWRFETGGGFHAK